MKNNLRQKQLRLPLRLADFASFKNFVSNGSQEAVTHLRALSNQEDVADITLLFGAHGVGKTHLLHACARAAAEMQRVQFIAVKPADSDVEILANGIETGLICVDDVHGAAGRVEWEEGLFALIERSKTTDVSLLFSSLKSIPDCEFGLKDLASRLTAGSVFHLQDLDDEAKQQALKIRASERGFELGDDVVQYIFNRLSRDTHSLFALLDQIDDESISASRKVTVPFVGNLLKTFRLE